MMNFGTLEQKRQKLLSLKEISPSIILEMDLFSDRKPLKIQPNPVHQYNGQICFKKAQSESLQIRVLTSNQNKEQIKNKNQKAFEQKGNQQRESIQKQMGLNQNYHSKSMTSTKPNSDKLSESNLSLQDSDDFKNQNHSNHINLVRLNNYNINSSINLSHLQKASSIKNQINFQQNNLKITDFQILNFCGEGSFGAVYIVRHLQTNAIFALKKNLKDKNVTQIDQQCLIKEMKIHLKLDHPNIIKFYTAFSTEDAIYFLMELCCSGNLFEKLKRQGSFEQNNVKSIIRQVSSAISHLHEQNIIHRDIKAQNIVLHGRVAKLCDFGWASEGKQSRKSLCGTPVYISPQIVKNQSYDNKVDVWSLGVLTYELIYGKIPFDIRCKDDLKKIVDEQISFPKQKQVSFFCKDFISKCLEKDSFKRWDISRILKHPFLKRQ